MTGLRLDTFAGIAPRYSKRLLPPQAATAALNCKLLSGELRGLRAPRMVKDLTAKPFTVRKVYRIPSGSGQSFTPDSDDIWMAFDSRDVDIVRSPAVNDSFERYYWSGDSSLYSGVPKYNTKARIANGDAPYRLGVPEPVNAPTLSAPSVATNETRAYVYTFVSAYGEEGPPSKPTLYTGDPVGTWTISGMDTSVPSASERNITKKRIYRTVPGQLSTSFFFVKEVNLSDASTTDSAAGATVVQNNLLESTEWIEPPAGLQGMVVMPNGYLVGFVGRDLYFSEPYRPHAWPAGYSLAVDYEIVGLAVIGSTLAVLTKSCPYLATGVNPSSVTLMKLNTVEPCLTKRSIVTTLAGVFYVSPNGMVGVDGGGARIITYDLFTKEEWTLRFNPTNVYAAPYGMQYVAFNSPDFGFVFSPSDTFAKLTELDRFDGVDGVDADSYSGDLYIIKGNKVLQWDPATAEPLYYTWRSKEFVTPKPVNFSAAKLKFNTQEFDVENDLLDYYGPFNTTRIAQPLHAIGYTPMGGVRTMTVPGWQEPQNRSPIGGSPLFPLTLPLPGVRLTVYADGDPVMSTVVYDEGLIRLPSGFKSDVWQFELIGNSDVYSLVVAETSKELTTL